MLKGDKLYGRGGADDGYAIFGSLAAILALQEQGVPHARCVVLIEACEESGSYDLPSYVDHLADRIGKPSLVVCLDSGCGNYDQLWLTTSLRGMAGGNLDGQGAGRRRAFRRRLGHRAVELPHPARSCCRGSRTKSPARSSPKDCTSRFRRSASSRPARRPRCSATRSTTNSRSCRACEPMADDLTELVLNRTWRPALSVTGADGLPPLRSAGNVLRPYDRGEALAAPAADAGRQAGGELLKEAAAARPAVRRARSTFELGKGAQRLERAGARAVARASASTPRRSDVFGAPAMYMGEGGTIPFMGMLGEKFPGAQFLITGVLGPHSNAHGPNEFLHIPTGKRVTACVAESSPTITAPAYAAKPPAWPRWPAATSRRPRLLLSLTGLWRVANLRHT